MIVGRLNYITYIFIWARVFQQACSVKSLQMDKRSDASIVRCDILEIHFRLCASVKVILFGQEKIRKGTRFALDSKECSFPPTLAMRNMFVLVDESPIPSIIQSSLIASSQFRAKIARFYASNRFFLQ